jgi:Mg-chelatase subunit ChlD
MTDVQNAAKRFLNSVQNFPIVGDKAGLVYYSDTASLDERLTDNFDQVKQAIDAGMPGGCTNIAAALRAARIELGSSRANNRGLKVAVLLSDGRTNTRITGDTTPCRDIDAAPGNPSEVQALQQARDMLKSGIVLYAISLGLDTNQNLMSKMATETGGEHFFAPTTKQLDEVFQQVSERIPVVLVN